jgi:MFS family permease
MSDSSAAEKVSVASQPINATPLEPVTSKPLTLCDITSNPIEASVPFSIDNPYHPYHWDWKKKYGIVIAYCTLQVFVTLTSTSYVAAEYYVQEKFGVNAQVSTLGQSMFIIGTAVGPAFMGPLSDLGGRKWIYVFSIAFYVIFNFGCAFPLNMPMLAIFMFIIGLCGSTALSNVAGTIGDLFCDSDEASQPMSLFVFSANAGPSIGGIVGEAIMERSSLGFKWIFIINIIIGAVFVFALCFVPETLPRIVIQERTATEGENVPNVILREFKYFAEVLTLKKPSYEIIYEQKLSQEGDEAVIVNKVNVFQEIRFIALQALKMMVTEPIIIFMGLYNGFAYGILFLYLDGIFDVFVVNNNLTPIAAECTYLNFVVAVAFVILLQPIQTWLFKKDRLKNNGVARPEARFLISLVTVWGFPLGLFWFAFTSDGSVNYWSPIMAGFVLGIADPLLWLAMLSYIIDSYSAAGLSNSAIAAFCIPSFGIAAALAHAGVAMFENMSTTWAMATLGFISIGIVALVYIFYFFGRRLRAASKLAKFSVTQEVD